MLGTQNQIEVHTPVLSLAIGIGVERTFEYHVSCIFDYGVDDPDMWLKIKVGSYLAL